MGIGDVTEPLVPVVTAAMHAATREMGTPNGFRGYEDSGVGYMFLREAIVGYYASQGVTIGVDDIFVSDGAKCDVANIQEIFSPTAVVATQSPVYPVYLDTNIMAGRTVYFMECTPENDFSPPPPTDYKPDLIYLCYPNNPTGATASKEYLRKWVEYALINRAIIIFDAAYEAYITEPGIPHSIYEVPNAERCAIELRSFSKHAGFTGVRCAYMVIPKELKADGVEVNPVWRRRHCTKFNGVSYITQRGAEAALSEPGLRQVQEQVDDYMKRAGIIRSGLERMGLEVYGGKNAPYIWIKAPGGMNSWNFFDILLTEAHVVGTPGSGFGDAGERFLRLTSFAPLEDINKALEQIKAVSW
jgi:LL-diaminopimelate aminotransferase